MTSPDITITPIREPFSNSNCEVAIASLPTINSIAIVMYRPSGKNFCILKYNEALAEINQLLTENQDETQDKQILLMGDFNFPTKIVRWLTSEGGIIPDFAIGDFVQKKLLKNC